jgi:hypothetical protein
MDNFAQELDALAAIANVPPEHVQPLIVSFAPELVSGAAATTRDIQIPTDYCAVLFNFAIDSYPKIGGSFDLTRRQSYSYADVLSFQFSKDGSLVTTPQDYHFYLGDAFVFSDQGLLTLAVQLQSVVAIDSQKTNIAIRGGLVPRSGGEAARLSRMASIRL